MRKDRLYFFTFLAITAIFILIAGIAIRSFIKVSANQLLETQLEASKREAKEVATLIGFQLASGMDKDEVIRNVQESIENTDTENGFICMFDWSGKEICHPDVTRVGEQVSPNQSSVSSVNGAMTSEDFYDLLTNKRTFGGIRDFGNDGQDSEIIYLYPVPNSDWIIGAHANVKRISNQISGLRNKFYTIFIIMGFAIILSSVIMVRLIGSSYEKRLEAKNQRLEDEVVNLAKLNKDLDAYQQKVIEAKPQTQKSKTEKGKKRILTYVRNELKPISTDDIAYIFMESTITYVVCFDGSRSTTNLSLDELFSNLDETHFYRANRQFIVAISAIGKIIKYGNNQLKILVNPNSEVDIIISKNRAAEFKQWLNS
ncbi:LytTR family transcriptional regulator [Flagellimonas allohymeniacidonis]|uniref:LytTR family transcriptional regulator n=1 Tax=Flagellimonas allohymeniacidonis TaxID=2517819 RepID=A0A4Q8Q9B4_9FLAO|nr:LytTR family transcriptional regulator [Allomuricauda hymeniacidonis]TAI46855.1 LytTR family transcriptional regulator [Allomuricauda hymeniacidonis]